MCSELAAVICGPTAMISVSLKLYNYNQFQNIHQLLFKKESKDGRFMVNQKKMQTNMFFRIYILHEIYKYI